MGQKTVLTKQEQAFLIDMPNDIVSKIMEGEEFEYKSFNILSSEIIKDNGEDIVLISFEKYDHVEDTEKKEEVNIIVTLSKSPSDNTLNTDDVTLN